MPTGPDWLRLTAIALITVGALGCGSGTSRAPGGGTAIEPAAQTAEREPDHRAAPQAACPADSPAPRPLPGVTSAELTLGFWLGAEQATAVPEQPLVSAHEIASLRARAGLPVPATPPMPITRKALLQEAWRYLEKDPPAEVGDQALLTPLLGAFGVPLASGADGRPAGSFTIGLAGVASARERLLLIEAAAAKGVVLLHAPGHLMLHLGRGADGTPRVLHAPAQLLTGCGSPPGPVSNGQASTRLRIGRPVVSGLGLGGGSPGAAFTGLLAELDAIIVFGASPGVELAAVATPRAAVPVIAPTSKSCNGRHAAALFVTPRAPSADRRLQVVAASSRDLGPVELALIDPAGKRQVPTQVSLGGPPFGRIAGIDAPSPGRWMAVLGDGERVDGCVSFTVLARRSPYRSKDDGPIWEPRRRWTTATENLYALFVQRLFDYSIDQDISWPNLHSVLRDRDHNLLYDYLSLGEDDELKLVPDCADLPYTLRAYFAWKLGLPFGYLRCHKEKGRPPICGDPDAGDNLMPRDPPSLADAGKPRDELERLVFARFANGPVRNGVQSANGRTAPGDELTDFFPVPLTRAALRPGTIFADPYGHLIVIAGWYSQPVGSYGLMVGADAQPDGTIGRRRFWPGSFLFTPDVTYAGAGFKAYRPRILEKQPDGTRAYRLAEHRELRGGGAFGLPAYSREQYKGTLDDFYAKMDSLINPRPLDSATALKQLVDSLDAEVTRRVLAVQNGEDYLTAHPGSPVAMPPDDAIFQTTGPWEDFATPSRDMRLLIAIDTVMKFPARVAAAPHRYGLAPGPELARHVDQLRAELDAELRRRTIVYTRTDASKATVILRDVVDRAPALEMAYNPNDCVEVRWGAPEGSPEAAPCRRHAPPEQRARMEKLRSWFATRQRPLD